MKRIWNYILFSTWRLLNHFGGFMIRKPIYYVMLRIFPFLRNNKNKAYSSYRKVMNDKYLSFNIAFAIGYMFFTTIFIYAIIFLYLGYFLEWDVGDYLNYWFIAGVILSYLTNHILSLSNDKYLKYFSEFERSKNKSNICLPAVLFHAGVLLITVLSVYCTIGFNL